MVEEPSKDAATPAPRGGPCFSHILKTCPCQHAIMFFMLCHVWSRHRSISACPPPPGRAEGVAGEHERDVSTDPKRHTTSTRYLIATIAMGLWGETHGPTPGQKDGSMTWFMSVMCRHI